MIDKMNNYDIQLQQLIHVERGIIPDSICDNLVEEIEKKEWSPHSWYNRDLDTSTSEETMELDILDSTVEHNQLLTPFIIDACKSYNTIYAFDCERTTSIMTMFNRVRFNRYMPGQIMRQHQDHIHTLFDGNTKGIPVISIIINLNDDYEGAELYFWDDYVVPLGKGDILMFPSLFLFPHGVKEPTKGKRYSGVSWAW